MKAAFKKDGRAYLKDVELRSVRADEVRLKVDACGICGTDLHEHPQMKGLEAAFGHEIAGTIVEVGHGAGLSKGQRVVLDSSTPCGRCEQCHNGRQELCTDTKGFFRLKLGLLGMAEEFIAPAISAIPCEGLSPEVACLQEPLGVAIDMVRLAEVRIDSNVLICGQGPIGLMALALVRRAGARRVFVSDFRKRTGRARLAEPFGAEAFIDPTDTPLGDYDFGCPIDRVLVTSPPETLAAAFGLAAKGAIISFIGIAYGEGAFCTFDANDFHFKKLQLRASFAAPALFGPMALQYLREGVVDGEAIISHRFPLARIDEALRAARSDPAAVKVVVTA